MENNDNLKHYSLNEASITHFEVNADGKSNKVTNKSNCLCCNKQSQYHGSNTLQTHQHLYVELLKFLWKRVVTDAVTTL